MSSGSEKILLCVLERPTQYDPPLWRSIRERGFVNPEVLYMSAETPNDPELNRSADWGAEHSRDITHTSPIGAALHLLRMTRKPAAVLTAGYRRRSTWAVSVAARMRRVPLIMPTDRVGGESGSNGMKRALRAVFRRLVYGQFNGFLTPGEESAQSLLRLGIPRVRIAKGLYPIDVTSWRLAADSTSPPSIATDLARLEPTFTVIAVKKFSVRESPLAVIDGFAAFQRRETGAVLILVGDGPLKADVTDRIAALGIGERVLLPGYVPYEELPTLYALADVFVHVPRAEPWGISVSEAMAVGLPVVTSAAVGSSTELVAAGLTGYQVPVGDPLALCEALDKVCAGQLSDPKTHIADKVSKIDVQAAAAEIEQLVGRLGDAARFGTFKEVALREVRRPEIDKVAP